LNRGADKISINSPALERPELINELAAEFGKQCVVVSVDSRKELNGNYFVHQYTGDETRTRQTRISTWKWLSEIQERGAGEVVLNCMDSDGVGEGYDIEQLQRARAILNIPLVASGGGRTAGHFLSAFKDADVDAALAAGAFHRQELRIPELKAELRQAGLEVRL
jgi:cyclase